MPNENFEVEKLYTKGIRLEYFTLGYNILEAAAAITLGGIATSIALIGFGLDSIVVALCGSVLL